MPSWYKQILNDWVSNLDVKANICMDIGGSQSPIKGRTRSWEVQEYRIMDLQTPHVEKQRPDLIQDMNYSLDWEHNKYFETVDLIFCLGVFDYVINPNIAMENIYTLLDHGGKAWIEFPFIYAHHEPLMEEGCRYSEGCIYRLCQQANLKITDMIRKMARSRKLLEFYAEDGQRMAKNYSYHGVTGFIVEVTK